jgi:hypothetical protein
MGRLRLAEQQNPPAPVTLPRLAFAAIDTEREAKETAARVAERKVIRAGVDAWQDVTKAESFDRWKAIGAALAIGKAHALKVTGANSAWGQHYSRAFCDWMREHHFDRMAKPVRSVAIELHENISAIEAWRETLPERQKRRSIHPLSVTRRWRAATTHNGKSPTDLKRDATAALARFISCMKLLPPDQAAPLWREAQAQAANHL